MISEADGRAVPTQEEILHSFEEQEESPDVAPDPQLRPKSKTETMPLIISQGLKIEDKQYVPHHILLCFNFLIYRSLRRALRRLVNDTGTPFDEIAKQRSSLAKEIKQWRKKYIKFAPLLEDSIAASSDAESIEHEALHLPSSFHLSERRTLELIDLGRFELKLREGQANSAITGICNCITHENLLVGFQRRHSRGVKQNTRSHKIINRIRAKRNSYAASYRECRLRLLSLNNTKALEGFPELKNDDMYQKNAADVRVLGEGKETDSWIWSYGNLHGLDEGQKQEFLNEGKNSNRSTIFLLTRNFS
jgi:hypothetical protein